MQVLRRCHDLVDLRDAKFDPDQRKQFIANGALLDD